MTDTLTLESRRLAVNAAREALRDVSSVLGSAAPEELSGFLTDVDSLVAAGTAARIAATAAAVSSGAIRSTQAGSVAAWVATHARSQQPKGAGAIAVLAQRLATDDDDDPIGFALADALLDGSLAPDAAMEVLAQGARLLPVVRDDCARSIADALVTMGTQHGPSGVRSVFPTLLARFGRHDLQRDQDAAAERIALSRAIPDQMGSYLYKFTADAETKALLEAAIGPLSKPVPGADGGQDPRSLEQRRGQALREVCRGGRPTGTDLIGSAAGGLGGSAARGQGGSAAGGLGGSTTGVRAGGGEMQPTPIVGNKWPTPKATLILTMFYDDLVARIGAAQPLASWDQETIIAPENVRRIACEAGVIPLVLGRNNAILNAGRLQRFFTIDQVQALWVRDRGCTFPGCVMPPSHCDAHHIRHWIDHGPTDLANGSLLCPRHHDIVHRDRLIGTLVDNRVIWDTAPGSYDSALEHGVRPPRPG